MKNKTMSRFFDFVLGIIFLIATGGLVGSILENQIIFAIILFLIMSGVAVSIIQLLGLQAKMEALQKVSELLRKDNAEKMAIIEGFKDFGK